MKCDKIIHPNIQPGWGCCKCRTYNGDQRPACKQCTHPRCDESESLTTAYNPATDKKMN